MSKKLTVTLHVDPSCAVRSGKSTVGECQLQLSDDDLAALSDDQRDTLARHLASAHEAWGGICTWGAPLTRFAPDIPEATPATLATLLDQRRVAMLVTVPAEHAKKSEDADAWIAKGIADAKSQKISIRYTASELGITDSHGVNAVSLERVGNVTPYIGRDNRKRASQKILDQLTLAIELAESEEKSERERLLPDARALMQAKIAKIQDEIAEYRALYARLPESMRERDAAGYASAEEIRTAIIEMAQRDAYPDYPGHQGWTENSEIKKLSDDEFSILQEIKKKAPTAARVQAEELFDLSYRDADDDDDSDDIDGDGEVKVISNVQRVISVSWSLRKDINNYLIVHVLFPLE